MTRKDLSQDFAKVLVTFWQNWVTDSGE
jgi:hypothetical protein